MKNHAMPMVNVPTGGAAAPSAAAEANVTTSDFFFFVLCNAALLLLMFSFCAVRVVAALKTPAFVVVAKFVLDKEEANADGECCRRRWR